VEVWGTGGGFLRPLFADFLEEAATVVGSDGLREAGVAYRQAGRGWTVLAEAATPDGIPPLAAFREAEAERAEARAAGPIPVAQGATFADAVVGAEAEAAAWLFDHPAESAELVATLAQLVEDVAAAERLAEATLQAAVAPALAGTAR
jgi:hypothetical protein